MESAMGNPSSAILRSLGYALIAAASLFSASIDAAAAADPYSSLATAEQRRACTPDVYRLCAAEIPSVSGITACLRRKKASLSDACKAVFEQ
jgi:hypothetical protein